MGGLIMKELFNTTFEMELRIVLLLSNIEGKFLSSEEITTLDFIVTYGKVFGISDKNMHGNSIYKFGEIASRRELVSLALKNLVTSGMLKVNLENGYLFALSDTGINYANQLMSEYANEYYTNANRAISEYGEYSAEELMRMIHNNSRGGEN